MTSRKRAGFIAGAGLGTAAAIALRRRWSGSDEPTGAPPPGSGSERGVGFLQRLAEAIRIPTVSGDGFDPAAFSEFRAFLERSYPLTHERLDVELVAEHSLLFRWQGTDGIHDPVLLLAHQDVVPVEPGTEEDWELPPFSGSVSESFLYGRGALDDKASLIGILEAVEGLLDDGFTPGPTVYVGLGHDEEAGGDGARAIASVLRERGVRLALVLDEGGAVAVDFFPGVGDPVGLIGVGEKGSIDLELSAAGQGGHSSAPPPHTAIGVLAEAVAAIEDHPMPPRLDAQRGLFEVLGRVGTGLSGIVLRNLDRLGKAVERRLAADPTTNALIRTTSAVTMIEGGVKPNVLPQRATAVVNFRIMPGDTVDDVMSHVTGIVPEGVGVAEQASGFSADPPPLAAPGSWQFELVADVVRRHFPVAAVAPWISTGATDSRHFADLADAILRFVPLTASRQDLGRFHGTGERVRIADADAAVGFYGTLLSSFGDRRAVSDTADRSA